MPLPGTLHTSIYRLCATAFLGSDWEPRQGGALVELAAKDDYLALDVLGVAERELGYWRLPEFAVGRLLHKGLSGGGGGGLL